MEKDALGDAILSTSNLTKRFGKKLALSGFNLQIRKGEIIGLVGPNGSGKTTLLNILMGMLEPTSGTYAVGIGVTLGMSVSRKGFFGDMTARQNIMLYSRLMGIEDIDMDRTLKELSIDFADVRFSRLSAGMKQRVSVILPFISPGNLIFLDEPSNHLDIDSLLALRHRITKLSESGVSFLITSHILSDLEKTCHRLVFMKNGSKRADFSTAELLDRYVDLEAAYLDVVRNE